MSIKERGGSESSDSGRSRPGERSRGGKHELDPGYRSYRPSEKDSLAAFIHSGPKQGDITHSFKDAPGDYTSIAKSDAKASHSAHEVPEILKDLPKEVREPAERLYSDLHELKNAENEIPEAIQQGDYTTAEGLVGKAQEHALAALTEAIRLADIASSGKLNISIDVIHAAEDRLGIPKGTFDSCFGLGSESLDFDRKFKLTAQLLKIRENLAKAPIEKKPRGLPTWLLPTIKVTSAVLVAAAVGAPLAAMAVGESVVNEFIKAGITTTVGAVGGEFFERLRQRYSRPNATPVPGPITSNEQEIRDKGTGRSPSGSPTTRRVLGTPPTGSVKPGTHGKEASKPPSDSPVARRIPWYLKTPKPGAHNEAAYDPPTESYRDTSKPKKPDVDPPPPSIGLGP